MIITLQNDDLTVRFSTLGGALTSIQDKDGVERLWQGDATYWSGQAPVLFPNCGSVRRDKTVYRMANGEEVEGHLPRHGLVRKEIFDCETLENQRVVFHIRATEAMKANYPYDFKLRIVYTLDGAALRTEYQVTNLGEEAMPYFIGGHPGFTCPLFEGEGYSDYYLEFEKEETCTSPRQFPDTGLLDVDTRAVLLHETKYLPLSFDLFSYDAVTLDQLASRSVSLRSHKHTKGLRLDFKDFPYLVLWTTTNQGPFIAVEPWGGLSTTLSESDYFEDKANVTWVGKGEISTKQFDIRIF